MWINLSITFYLTNYSNCLSYLILMIVVVSVVVVSSYPLARPKSQIFKSQFLLRSRLLGFKREALGGDCQVLRGL